MYTCTHLHSCLHLLPTVLDLLQLLLYQKNKHFLPPARKKALHWLKASFTTATFTLALTLQGKSASTYMQSSNCRNCRHGGGRENSDPSGRALLLIPQIRIFSRKKTIHVKIFLRCYIFMVCSIHKTVDGHNMDEHLECS